VDPPSFLLRRSWIAFCRELLVDEQPHQWTPRLLSELLVKLIRIAFEKNWKRGYFKEFGRALETENFGKLEKRLRRTILRIREQRKENKRKFYLTFLTALTFPNS
jgi:hypothetical protein